MSPLSLLNHSIARSSPRSIEFADFRDLRRLDLGMSRKHATGVQSQVRRTADEVRVHANPADARSSGSRFVGVPTDESNVNLDCW
jgi:hypothetical protein